MEDQKIYKPLDTPCAHEMDWDSIPDSEKVTSDEIENIDAKSEGILDGFNHELNKRVNDAIYSGNPTESLKEIRKDLKIPGPVYGVNIAEFIKSNREILFSRVEQNLLSAVCESILVLGKELTKALYEQAVSETLRKQANVGN